MEMHGAAKENCAGLLPMTSFLKQIARIALRFLCLSVGAWLTAVFPVAIMASNHQTSNAAAGYSPDIDPGAMVIFAEIFTVPVIVAVVVIELLRCWAFEKKPLSLPAYAALGALVASPIGLAFTRHEPDFALVPAGFMAAFAIATGYALWQGWRTSR